MVKQALRLLKMRTINVTMTKKNTLNLIVLVFQRYLKSNRRSLSHLSNLVRNLYPIKFLKVLMRQIAQDKTNKAVSKNLVNLRLIKRVRESLISSSRKKPRRLDSLLLNWGVMFSSWYSLSLIRHQIANRVIKVPLWNLLKNYLILQNTTLKI